MSIIKTLLALISNRQPILRSVAKRSTWLIVIAATFQFGCSSVNVKKLVFAPSDHGKLSDRELSLRNIESLSINTEDGENLHAIYLLNDKSTLLTLYFHGNGGNVHQRIVALEKLKSLGTSVLSVSYRGYLNSTGSASEKGIYEDAKATLEYATNTLNYNRKNIVVMGRSLGSAAAIDLVQNKALAGVILISPFSSAQDLFDTLGTFKKKLIYDPKNYIALAFRNIEKSPAIRSKTLIVHGTNDTLIPYRLGRLVYDSLTAEKQFLPLTGAGHNDFGYQNRSKFDNTYWLAIRNFFKALDSR